MPSLTSYYQRVTKYHPLRVNRILAAIEAGVPPMHAAAMADVGRATYYEWLQRYPEFSDGVLAAQAKLIKKRLDRIDTAGAKGNWQADAWTLERLFPGTFGRTFGPAEKEQPAQVQISVVEIVPPALPAGDIVEVPPENVRELRPGE